MLLHGKKIKWKPFRSFKVRIAVILILVGTIPSIIMGMVLLHSYESQAISAKTIDLQAQCNIISNLMLSNDYLKSQDSEMVDTELEQIATSYNGRVVIIDKSYCVIKDTYELDEGKTSIAKNVIRCFRGETVSDYDADNSYIEMTVPIMKENIAGNKEILGVIVLTVSTDEISTTLETLSDKVHVLVVAILLITFGVSIGLVYYLVRPVTKIGTTLDTWEEGILDNELSAPEYEETEQIAEAFNRLLRKMRTLDQSREEFVSNVSHELKTPITSMKVLADSLLMQEEVPAELYKEFLADIVQEIDRENQIVTDLLSLVKMDKTSSALNVDVLDINEMIEKILKRLRPIAKQRNIEVLFESFRHVTAEVDEVKLSLAFNNLVENAIKYNIENGWVHVSLNADHKYFYVKVQDSGVGIPEDSVDRIFERFYRVDKSHSREIGGTGLGLAITRSAILMHRGAVKVDSVEGEGTTFTVRIPLTYVVN